MKVEFQTCSKVCQFINSLYESPAKEQMYEDSYGLLQSHSFIVLYKCL